MAVGQKLGDGMILSIESSCDDSSIAVTELATKKLVYHKKISQDEQHAVYGGVVPELAARLHTEALPRILAETKEFFPRLKAVAVTNEPGLTVSLLEGVTMAKALAVGLGLPVVPVNHLVGHIYSLFIEGESRFPLTVLLVSGGHTMILEVEGSDRMRVIGSTMDDSFGESFDKAAKMLGLAYPGGPAIEQLAREGDAAAHAFTIPLLKHAEVAFSFSGLKNAVRLAAEKADPHDRQAKADIAASFQRVAVAHVMRQLEKVFRTRRPGRFAVVGGASANSLLRGEIEKICNTYQSELLLAPLAFCSDNAAMIGRAAADIFAVSGGISYTGLTIRSRSVLN